MGYSKRQFYCYNCKCKLTEDKYKIEDTDIKNNINNVSDKIENSNIKYNSNIKEPEDITEYKKWKKTKNIINLLKSNPDFKNELIKELGISDRELKEDPLNKIMNLGLLMRQMNGTTTTTENKEESNITERNEIHKILGIK